jgi:DnaJ like chaperone protein
MMVATAVFAAMLVLPNQSKDRMSGIWGKLVGAAMGFTLGGPLGLAVGIAAGHAFDERDELGIGMPWTWGSRVSGFSGTSQQAAFTNGVIVLGAKMAKVDGRVTRAKINAFKKAFQIKPEDEVRVGRLFDTARKSVEGFEPYAFSLAQTFISHPGVLEEILSGLFLVAAADDNGISPAESDFLRSVAFTFNFGPDDFMRIAARTGVRLPSEEQTREARREVKRDSASDPYVILGINDKTSNDDIKAAYRNLIRKHHPDKLIAEGMPPEFIDTANEKMKRINVAYDTICKMRGIK